jgi:hypothetical protein
MEIFYIYQPVCPPLSSITACNIEGIEWHKSRSFVPLIELYSLLIIAFNSPKFLGHVWPRWTTSFRIFQRFSSGLKLGEFEGQLSFSIRHIFHHSLHNLLQWTGALSSISNLHGTLPINWSNWPSHTNSTKSVAQHQSLGTKIRFDFCPLANA